MIVFTALQNYAHTLLTDTQRGVGKPHRQLRRPTVNRRQDTQPRLFERCPCAGKNLLAGQNAEQEILEKSEELVDDTQATNEETKKVEGKLVVQ